ncbi:zincin [Lichtheimia hyalospora FSU 10163]|nr:zincin [Lichtheimia hyalospora FSU 10163]
MTQLAPAPALDFSINADQVKQITKDIIDEELRVNNEIAALKPEDRTYENIVPKLARIENTLSGKIQLVSSLSQISPDSAIRDASVAAEKQYEEFSIEQTMRHDLYVVIQGLIDKTDLKTLDHEEARMLSKMERSFRRNGLHLPEEKRNEFKELRKRLSEVGIEYMKNWSNESSTIKFTKEELEGMDDDFLGGLKTVEEDGVKKYVLTMKYPDVRPVLKLCKIDNTRKAYAQAFESRNRENIVLLEEALRLRRQCAKILGYKTHADYVLEVKMAKTVDAVRNFLNDLATKLRQPGLKDVADLKQIKKDEKAARGEEFDDVLNPWDTSYYERILLEKEYSLDQEKIKKYFSLETTIQKMLEIYEKVLGLKFVKIPAEKAVVWHPDVQLFECWDAVEDKSFSGYMYLDLFPRDNKYPHAACFPLQPSYIAEDGSRVAPIAAMVANFTKPTADKPSLLKHDEVVTLFHELGHVMHHLCSRTKFARFHGTSVEGDFVEAPSQMLENWCYDRESLKYLSAHFETGEPISDDMIDRIIKSKNVLAALFNLRQLFFGIYDMEIHTSEDEHIDTTKLYNELREKISLVKAPEGSCGQASFGHLMGGYDAGYYGYMWSKVFSSDMFYTKFESDTLSAKTGYSYRKCILEKGSSKDGMDLLIDFLGREPSSDAFMREDIGMH